MRVAIVSESAGRVGGVETYLETVVPALLDRGHCLAFLPGSDGPADRPTLRLPAAVTRWPPARGRTAPETLAALRAWRPDVLFAHCLEDAALEAAVFAVAPTVFFAHAYYGTCLSGYKSHWFPDPCKCERRFGPGCLVRYFPRRCGGLNPATMLALYRKQGQRLRNLADCAAVVVLSEHMAAEYRRHDVLARVLPPLRPPEAGPPRPHLAADPVDPIAGGELRVAFVGRLEKTKGARLLLEALPRVARALDLPVRCRLAGRGEEEGSLRARAGVLADGDPRVRVEFPGWLDAGARRELFEDSHLLAVPSRWPEPFGLVGLEAAAHGVPAVACHVGGVASWLDDGVSGLLAPAADGRCRSPALADTLVAAVRDPARYRQLRAGARARLARVHPDAHVAHLEETLQLAARGKTAAIPPP